MSCGILTKQLPKNPDFMHVLLKQLEHSFSPSILTPIQSPFLEKHGVELWLKRDDLLHPIISGNKWRKLKYSLNHALTLNKTTLISMGGVYSNHLHALAYVGKELGLKTVGLIRGEDIETPTLHDLKAFDMELRFVSRGDYRTLREYKTWDSLPNLVENEYWLPEGGASTLALQGVSELVSEIEPDYDVFCVACGTGTTLAGLISAVPENVAVLGFAALKNAAFLNHDVAQLLVQPRDNWQIQLDYHHGGFAKISIELLEFMRQFETETGILLEPVYTGKLLFGLYDLIAKNHFSSGQRIIALHTGGLQGRRGFNKQFSLVE